MDEFAGPSRRLAGCDWPYGCKRGAVQAVMFGGEGDPEREGIAYGCDAHRLVLEEVAHDAQPHCSHFPCTARAASLVRFDRGAWPMLYACEEHRLYVWGLIPVDLR